MVPLLPSHAQLIVLLAQIKQIVLAVKLVTLLVFFRIVDLVILWFSIVFSVKEEAQPKHFIVHCAQMEESIKGRNALNKIIHPSTKLIVHKIATKPMALWIL